MISENVDPRMAIAQVVRELSIKGGDVEAFMSKISSAEDNVEAYKICMETISEVWG